MISNVLDRIAPRQRIVLMVLFDFAASFASVIVAFFLVFGVSQAPFLTEKYFSLIPLFVIVRLLTFRVNRLYAYSWRYASTREFIRIIISVTLGTVLIGLVLWTLGLFTFPMRVILADWGINLVAIGSVRVMLRILRDYLSPKSEQSIVRKNLLIIGAGEAGISVAREVTRVSALTYNLKGFVDDKKNKVGRVIYQTPVLGLTSELPTLVREYGIDEVIIAIPSASGKTIRHLMSLCEEAGVKFKSTPGLADIIGGKISINQVREVRIEDLLRRDVIKMDSEAVAQYIAGATVLVTGAGGSIGSELCRQIQRFSPKILILFDHDENALYQIHMELNENTHNATAIVPVVSDIKCKAHLETLFEQYRPQVVFHAAAHKHVPLMENNVREVVENNIGGTCNLLKMASKYNVKDFVFISTDKAVRPTNCMGATKRIGEVMLQMEAAKNKTKFSAVRFGNVLGSQGSVIPLFKKQIAEGGPITITHPDITRYFMTIPEAVSLVIQTGALSQGGEIFILDMGEPVTILSLAQDLIRLSGLELGKDIDIKVTGLRPGEKMFEELFFDKSNLTETPNKKIFVTHPYHHDEAAISQQIQALIAMCHTRSEQDVRNTLFALVKQTEPQ